MPASPRTKKTRGLMALISSLSSALRFGGTCPPNTTRSISLASNRAMRRTPGIASVAAPQLNPARDTAAIAVYPATSPQSGQTTRLVKHLRDDVLPPLAKATGTTLYVGGATAIQVDFAHVLSGKLPLWRGGRRRQSAAERSGRPRRVRSSPSQPGDRWPRPT
jgi:hypothetical protein